MGLSFGETMFRKEDIDRLIAHHAFPTVTLSLPTHMGSRDVRQDRIRLRNLSTQASERLAAAGLDRRVADQLLAPVRSLAEDETFWLEQAPGLVLFVASSLFEIMRLPFSPAEELSIGSRFHIRHLLPALDGDYPFLVLAISARRARLFEAGRYDIREVVNGDFPIQGPEPSRDVSDLTREGNGNGRRAIAQEQGVSEFADFFARIADATARYANGRDIPVVLAAMPEFAGHFRGAARVRNLTHGEVSENAETLSERELHRLAYEKIRPLFAARENQVLEKFDLVFGQSQARASIDVAEVVEAARTGRVDTLFVADDSHVWGRLDPTSGLIQHSERNPEDEDLLDYATAETWRNGGAVRVLPRFMAPFGKPVSAIFRY